ncbi:MAG: spermidine/putrescine ABC transporter substrate-binding protein [Gemmatimonadota bacterium]
MSAKKEAEKLVNEVLAGGVSRREFVTRATALGLSLSSIGMVLTACARKDADKTAGADSTAAMADLGPIEKELNIYNWSDYIAEDTVPNFEKEFGVKVTYDTYESNEEMVAKLQAGAAGYDIVVPSGYIIPVLTATDLIQPVHPQYLTNAGNLAPIFRDLATDPRNRFTVPWQWGTTGIAYRTDKVNPAPDSWAVFQNAAYHKKMTMMDDGREVIGAFLRFKGHSLNSRVPAELQEAKLDSIAAKAHLKAYISAPVKDQLIAGDVHIAQLWNGDTSQAKVSQPNLGYVLPKEGCTIWSDSLVIPKSSQHPRAAHEFMNYIMRPEVAAAISNFTGYGSPNAKAVLATPVPYPSTEELARLEYQIDLGADTQLWDQIWTEIKS